MRNTLSTIVGAAAIFVAGGAMAGSVTPAPVDPIPTPPAPAAMDWSGFYVGALGGMQDGDITFPILPGFSIPVDGTTYGGFAGYNFQQGALVYGVEVAAQMGTGTLGPVPGVAFDFDYVVDARARLGYAFDSVLVYAAGGVSTVQMSAAGTSITATGWNAGVGAEIGLTDNIFVGGEYIYRSLSGTSAGLVFEPKTHGFQARIGYRF